jgi:hypothetical protein
MQRSKDSCFAGPLEQNNADAATKVTTEGRLTDASERGAETGRTRESMRDEDSRERSPCLLPDHVIKPPLSDSFASRYVIENRILVTLEHAGAVRNERRAWLGHTVGKRKAKLGDKQPLNVWPANIHRLLDLLHTENLNVSQQFIELEHKT